MATLTASAVANEFLDIQDQDTERFPPIDQMKLQKLIYYAHAWFLAMEDKPLFEEDIEAWPWGPVVRNVYLQFKDCGRKPIIGDRAFEIVRVGEGPMAFKFRKPSPPTPEIREFLKHVWESHKHMSGVQLSNATHAEGEPWAIVKNEYGDLDGKPTIPNELIKDVFKSKIAGAEIENPVTA